VAAELRQQELVWAQKEAGAGLEEALVWVMRLEEALVSVMMQQMVSGDAA
jgi:hypothetical protein